MTDHEDLDWLAFRYVASELDGEAMEQFEAQLEHSQDAREAVVRACEMADCVVAIGESSKRNVSLSGAAVANGWMQWGMGRAFGAAICLLLVLTSTGLLKQGGDSETPFTAAPGPETESLATIWTETRHPFDESPWEDLELEVDTLDAAVAVEGVAFGHGELQTDDQRSTWIQAAVYGMAVDGFDEADMEGSL